ncbi:hypothetical protein ACH46J_34320, partial [Streptomyces triculaminicus]
HERQRPVKRPLAAGLAVLLLAATLTACADAPDDCGAAPVALAAATKPAGKARPQSRPKAMRPTSKAKATSEAKHHDIDICEDED